MRPIAFLPLHDDPHVLTYARASAPRAGAHRSRRGRRCALEEAREARRKAGKKVEL
jgi:hypothetical protein